MFKTTCISLLALCCYTGAAAQSVTPEVVTSSGGYFSSTAGSLSWTLGEPVTETFSNVGHTVTQGFQQNGYFIIGLAELAPEITVSVFPNPSPDIISIKFESASHAYTTATIATLSGSVLVQSDIAKQSSATFNLQALAAGPYVLTIAGAGANQSITIIKQ